MGREKIGYRMESRIGSQINEIRPGVCFPGLLRRPCRTRSNYSVRVNDGAGGGRGVYIEKETGPEAEMTNDSMGAEANRKVRSLQIS